MKLAIVTCYKQPDYIRAQTLRDGAVAYHGIELITIKNRHLGILRYPETIIKVIAARIRHRPDAYLLTFRGYEILPFLAILTWPKPLIYDEFINPLEWLQEPRDQRWAKFVPKAAFGWFYRQLLRRCKVILADTDVHADYSQKLSQASKARYVSVPVSTSEALFRPSKIRKPVSNKIFRVFYYGNMLPLHGLAYVLESADRLKHLPIEFMLAGGNPKTQKAIQHAKDQGAHVSYIPWIDFKQLPKEIERSDLCLGGPYGGTIQANHVITGKTYQFLACQAPTVVGANKATNLFKDKQNCLLIPQQDAESLATAIVWAYEHPKQLREIALRGRLLYETNFSQKIVAKRLQAILDSAV